MVCLSVFELYSRWVPLIGPGISFTPVTAYEILSFKAEMKQIKFFFC